MNEYIYVYFQASGSCADPIFILDQLIGIPYGRHATEPASWWGSWKSFLVSVGPIVLRNQGSLRSLRGLAGSLGVLFGLQGVQEESGEGSAGPREVLGGPRVLEGPLVIFFDFF